MHTLNFFSTEWLFKERKIWGKCTFVTLLKTTTSNKTCFVYKTERFDIFVSLCLTNHKQLHNIKNCLLKVRCTSFQSLFLVGIWRTELDSSSISKVSCALKKCIIYHETMAMIWSPLKPGSTHSTFLQAQKLVATYRLEVILVDEAMPAAGSHSSDSHVAGVLEKCGPLTLHHGSLGRARGTPSLVRRWGIMGRPSRTPANRDERIKAGFIINTCLLQENIYNSSCTWQEITVCYQGLDNTSTSIIATMYFAWQIIAIELNLFYNNNFFQPNIN